MFFSLGLLSLVSAKTLQPVDGQPDLLQLHMDMENPDINENTPDRLTNGNDMTTLISDSGCVFSAIFQDDGNLVVYDCCGSALWASNTWGTGADRCAFQDDGNLVVYQGSNPKWDSKTYGSNYGDVLIMQTDGNLVIYDSSSSSPKWHSATHGQGCSTTCVDNCEQCTASACFNCEDGYELLTGGTCSLIPTSTEYSVCADVSINDDFCDFTNLGTLEAGIQSIHYDNSAASVETGEPAGDNSVWYRFRIAKGTTSVTISQLAGSETVQFSLFQGPGKNYMCDGSTPVFAEFDETVQTGAGTISNQALQSGKTYYLKVSGPSGCGEAQIALN